MEDRTNDAFVEVKKFLNKDVIVRYHESDKVIELKGQLRFISFNHLSCIIMTDKEKILVKNIITISRKRKE